MNTHDSIDASAEREALAIERLAELLGTSVPQTRLQQVRGAAIAATALGLPEVQKPTYARHASYRAHAKITDANRTLLCFGPRCKYPRENTDAARIAKFRRRLEKLRELNTIPASKWIGISAAAKLSALGERTLQRACLSGTVAAHRDYTPTKTNGVGDRGRYLIQVRDVRRLLELKLSGRAITAA